MLKKDFVLVWIFASVVLVLLVVSVGFRVFVSRIALALIGLCVVLGIGYGLYQAYDYEFGPKVTIEGVKYREGSSEAVYAYGQEREHQEQKIAAETAAEAAEQQRRAAVVEKARIVSEEYAAQRRNSDTGASELASFNAALLGVYAKYPFLNSENPKHNQPAIDAVLASTNDWVAKGYTRANAVMFAADKIAPKFQQ
ncbi:hypothetical protein QN399_15950 [Pseudomonas sp. 10C3]|nr:hypothetical protein [Pseudomonas sp. 10C3]MEE3507730.1 hypothetical protein [Pseudomonas sp. 10C3]